MRLFKLYSYPTDDQLKLIYSVYLRNIFAATMDKHPKWSSNSNTFQLASSMVSVYTQVFILIEFLRKFSDYMFFTMYLNL